ncbi:hypothetical protein [Sorangium sp. So ce693]|uniref:hypothetical protein n=1 Tax=Sorangium sp. So ce693 TaxID=3133318 RepID=UPI003F629442
MPTGGLDVVAEGFLDGPHDPVTTQVTSLSFRVESGAMLTCSRRSTTGGLLVAVVAALAVVVPAGAAGASEETSAKVASGIAVGVQLEALSDVKVARAEVARGSRVSVARLIERQGQLTAVDVELADGHIARVAMATVRKSFRVLSE